MADSEITDASKATDDEQVAEVKSENTLESSAPSGADNMESSAPSGAEVVESSAPGGDAKTEAGDIAIKGEEATQESQATDADANHNTDTKVEGGDDAAADNHVVGDDAAHAEIMDGDTNADATAGPDGVRGPEANNEAAEHHMSDWIQVVGLGTDAEAEKVAEAFAKHGKVLEVTMEPEGSDTVSCFVRLAGESGASSLSAQAEDTKLCVEAALKNLDDTEICGKKISVRRAPPLAQLFVGNINAETTQSDIESLFAKYGKIVRTAVITKPTGEGLGYGFIEFAEYSDASRAAAQLNLTPYRERQLRVDFADCRSQSAKRSPILFVDQLPRGFLDSDKLRSIFGEKGTIVDLHLAKAAGNVPRLC